MKFNKNIYENLRRGLPEKGDFSRSKEIKLIFERYHQQEFCNVVDYLEEHNIDYESDNCSITVKGCTLTFNMVMYFEEDNHKKGYRYGYEKAIKRLLDGV